MAKRSRKKAKHRKNTRQHKNEFQNIQCFDIRRESIHHPFSSAVSKMCVSIFQKLSENFLKQNRIKTVTFFQVSHNHTPRSGCFRTKLLLCNHHVSITGISQGSSCHYLTFTMLSYHSFHTYTVLCIYIFNLHMEVC